MLLIFPVYVSAPVRTKSCASTVGNVPTNSLRTANPNFTSTERRAVTSYRGFLETAGCSPPALPSPKEKIYFTELCPLIRLINPEKSRFEIISLAVFTKETSWASSNYSKNTSTWQLNIKKFLLNFSLSHQKVFLNYRNLS
jgi:hypothetical protein